MMIEVKTTIMAERINPNGKKVRELRRHEYSDGSQTIYTVQEWNIDGLPCGGKNYGNEANAWKRFNRPLMNKMVIR